MNAKPILGFFGEHRFLSNFWYADVLYEGVSYPTVEHAYQAAKSLDPEVRLSIRNLATPAQAKKAGKRVTLRSDWEEVKVGIMAALVRQKFMKNANLAKLLYDTGDVYLEETNWWNDKFWGVCNGRGKNMLGIILMNTREEINNKINGSLAQR